MLYVMNNFDVLRLYMNLNNVSCTVIDNWYYYVLFYFIFYLLLLFYYCLFRYFSFYLLNLKKINIWFTHLIFCR